MLRKVLWKNNLLIAGEHMGGREPRSVYLAMRDGATYVRIRGRKILL
jgi:chemotaxis receptor (MCP) glutamine deamidase CheD